MINTYEVYIWPDGSWVGEDDVYEFQDKCHYDGDDYRVELAPADVDDLEEWVDNLLDHEQVFLDYQRGL